MQYTIEDKIFINDAGNSVNYKRFVIKGWAGGELQTIELPLSKDQAVIYKLLQAEAPSVVTSKGGEVDVSRKPGTILDDNETNKQAWFNDND